jgi:hypothetical protein
MKIEDTLFLRQHGTWRDHETLTFGTALSLAALLATTVLALADDVRTGKAAYGDWQTDSPGVTRKITVNDLNAPLETPVTANRSKVVAKPADAALKHPERAALRCCGVRARVQPTALP